MKEIRDVLAAVGRGKAARDAAKRTFLRRRAAIWEDIRERRFPDTWVSADGRKFSGAPRRTAIRCDYLLASKATLGSGYLRDRIVDAAQRDLLFDVLRYREVFPGRRGAKFYCCPRCTSKLYACVVARVFRYIDNAAWQSAIEPAE